MKNNKILEWYNKELEKDYQELEKNKKEFLNSLKKFNKKDLFENKEIKKISLWTRIKKVLMGI